MITVLDKELPDVADPFATDEVLLKAADILERDGRTNGALCHDGRKCALGAIASALGFSDETLTVRFSRVYDALAAPGAVEHVRRLADHLRKTYPHLASDPVMAIYRWNDSYQATEAEAVATIREAAVIG